MSEDRPSANAHIVIVDDDPDILRAGDMLLKRRFTRISCLPDPAGLPGRLADGDPAVVLLDMNFSPGESDGASGLAWLDRLRAERPELVIIAITAHGGVDLAVRAMKHGASDFVAKPWQNEKLVATVSSAAELAASRCEARTLRSRARALANDAQGQQGEILGRSPAIRKVLSLISRAGPTDANVLVLGENGTGKELAARAIHQASPRAEEPFLTVDLGAVPESLFESELFGHRKGAFTDAHQDRIGRVETASGGTLFLDEIGNLPLHLQAKLLSVLEQRAVTPVGATRATPVDVRIIAATNLAPDRLADERVFRQDLLFRLNTVEIVIPPLRERAEDIPELIRHYLDVYERKYGAPHRPVSDAAMAALVGYRWPGNIRALRHAAERAVILVEGTAYETLDFSLPATVQAVQRQTEASMPDAALTLEEMERRAVEAALTRHRFNISRAARDLGLTRAALYRRMEKHGL